MKEGSNIRLASSHRGHIFLVNLLYYWYNYQEKYRLQYVLPFVLNDTVPVTEYEQLNEYERLMVVKFHNIIYLNNLC